MFANYGSTWTWIWCGLFIFQYNFLLETRLWPRRIKCSRDHTYTAVSQNKYKSCDAIPTKTTWFVAEPAVPVPCAGVRASDPGPARGTTQGQVPDRREQGCRQKQGWGRTCCGQGTQFSTPQSCINNDSSRSKKLYNQTGPKIITEKRLKSKFKFWISWFIFNKIV